MKHFYKATREGYDGKVVRKPGEVFLFAGRRGSWMVPCDEHGNVAESVMEQRPTRLGTKQGGSLTRDDYREECRKLGIPFKATMGAADLAALIQEHEASKAGRVADGSSSSPENPDGGAPGVGTSQDAAPDGTGNQDVI